MIPDCMRRPGPFGLCAFVVYAKLPLYRCTFGTPNYSPKWQLPDEDEVKTIRSDLERGNRTNIQQKLEDLFWKLYHFPYEEQQKGSSSWLNVIPMKEMGSDFNKREFRDALHLRYYWSIPDNPAVCVCGDNFYHAMICKKGDLSR